MKNMLFRIFSIVGLCCLYGCVSIPKEEIINDPENVEKIETIKSALNEDVSKLVDTSCINKINTLNKIVEKDKINAKDYKALKDIYEDYGDGLLIHKLECSVDIDKSYGTQSYQLKQYCYNKYHDENDIVSVVLFPVRLANTTLAIGTMGIWCVFGTCSSRYSNFDMKTKDGSTVGFSPWTPGYTWNSDVCENMLPEKSEFDTVSFIKTAELQEKVDVYLKEKRQADINKRNKENKERWEAMIKEQQRQFATCMQNPTCKKEYLDKQQARNRCSDMCANGAEQVLSFAEANKNMFPGGCGYADAVRSFFKNYEPLCSIKNIFQCMTDSERQLFRESFSGCFKGL